MAASLQTIQISPSYLRPIQISPSSSLSSSLSIHHSHSPSLSLSTHTTNIPIAASPSSAAAIFPDDLALRRLQTLENYTSEGGLGEGWLEIRPMRDGEVDPTVQLLAESFVESMGMPPRYVQFLAFLVRQYVEGRRVLLPHAVMLVGVYREGDGDPEIAGTAEVSFDSVGANVSPPTPLPPVNCPYICNMAVKKEMRRRGIGFRLLMACEELIDKMKANHVIYLHCRVTDRGPLKMYKKAGYKIVKTDSRLVWLRLQQRKHLLSKEVQVEQGANQ